MSFVHLHVHTQFSIADATLSTADLTRFAAETKMPAVAITDHDNLHGAIEFTDACKKNGVKPIYGCCMSIASRPVGEHARRIHHLTLLAENDRGYQNLIYLVSMANLKAPDGGKTRIDWNLLKSHSEGLIGLSGDLAGEVSNALLRGEDDEAWQAVERYKSWFPPGNFYLEVQRSGLAEHDLVAPQLVELGRQIGVPCVATNDVHYLRPSDARAHEVLMCIGLGIQARPETQPMPTTQLDLASPDEMRRRFADLPHLCDNTLEIAERCNVKLKLGESMLPRYTQKPRAHLDPHAEPELSEADLFAKLARAGLERRYEEFAAKGKTVDKEVYYARLEREIGVITKMDFPGYFLIVQDFINWAKENDIPVGPGRGSGAGSLVAYSLRITDLDPLPYNLLFERFLNPERVSMPDFDVDFCELRRTEVIRYVSERYGQERVGQIATFGTLKAKGAVRDVGRVLGVPLADVDRLAKAIDVALAPLDEKKKTLHYAVEADAGLRAEMDASPQIKKLLETAELIEGSVRTVGMHAAGVVIGRHALWEHVPTGKGQAGENVTQFDKDDVEKAGLVKFDFLGLSNLTMIQHCVKLINSQRNPGQELLNIDLLPLDDTKAYDIVSRGDTAGIFQCESQGFTRMMVSLRPTEFEDLVAAGALYRPGPLGMGMHTRYIERKHQREPVEFPHEKLAEVLKETYGVIVYQEQVMQVAQILAHFSLGEADNLRRAMGKKKVEEMNYWGKLFQEGAVKNGVDADVAAGIFALMAKFAEYGFNKSHSAAYGLITYQTAWLKANYPVEFYAALLTRDQADTDSVVAYIQQARGSHIAVLPPDVNESQYSFSVSSGRVRFGLGAIKGLGEGAIEVLLQARKTGPFTSLFDLVRRIDTRKVNRKAMEVLIKSGAMDSFGQARDVLWTNVGRAIERAQEDQRERDSAQVSLFGMLGDASAVQRPDVYAPAEEPWTGRQTLGMEKEVLGFYVSGHPLDRYAKDLHRLDVRTLAVLKDPAFLESQPSRGRPSDNGPPPPKRAYANAAVVVVSHREMVIKDGRKMGITVLEDRSGQAEVLCFESKEPREGKDRQQGLDEMRELLSSNEPLLVRLQVGEDRRELGKVSLRLEGAKTVEAELGDKAEQLVVRIGASQCSQANLDALRALFDDHRGKARVRLRIHWPNRGEVVVHTAERWRVRIGEDLIGAAEKLLGRGCAVAG